MRYRGSAGASESDRDPTPDDPSLHASSYARVDYELLRRLEVKAHQAPFARAQSGGARQPDQPATTEATRVREVGSQAVTKPPGRLHSFGSESPRKSAPPDDRIDEANQGGENGEASGPAGSPARVPKVIVVDRRGGLAREIGKAAEGLLPEPEVLLLDRPTQVVEVAEDEDPDVIVFSGEEVTTAGLKRLALIHKAQPKVVILLSDNDRTWPAAQMAASGASDILPSNPTRARLRSKLAAALSTADQLRVENIVVTERVVVEKADPPAAEPVRASAALGRVFTVASASGGSGKTLLATNFATYLVKATGGKVLLIDLDLQFGEVAPSLHLHPEHTIEELARDPEELPATTVDHACGFKALCAPNDPLAGEEIGPDEVSAILETARRDFDYVIVDTPPTLNESCLVAFDRSEKVIVTANMDVPSLKNMRRFLETIEKLNVAPSQSVLVLNRVETGIGLDLKGVSQLFPSGFLTVLQVAKEVPWATNMGVPVLQGNPKSDVSRRLAEGFMKLVPPAAGVTLPWGGATASTPRSGRMGLRRGKS
jgi:Flp pilus assembly CpaE family ATPase